MPKDLAGSLTPEDRGYRQQRRGQDKDVQDIDGLAPTRAGAPEGVQLQLATRGNKT
jgi:hypothetical protein